MQRVKAARLGDNLYIVEARVILGDWQHFRVDVATQDAGAVDAGQSPTTADVGHASAGKFLSFEMVQQQSRGTPQGQP
ncbi:MAG TPA: hypothetical protein DIC52_21210 [Candidatus Latescibacteria bacterium]|nr:hypothetical protein [Candidatus Latescibacterota bacterium]